MDAEQPLSVALHLFLLRADMNTCRLPIDSYKDIIQYSCSSALIVLSHNDRVVVSLLIMGPFELDNAPVWQDGIKLQISDGTIPNPELESKLTCSCYDAKSDPSVPFRRISFYTEIGI